MLSISSSKLSALNTNVPQQSAAQTCSKADIYQLLDTQRAQMISPTITNNRISIVASKHFDLLAIRCWLLIVSIVAYRLSF